MSTTNDHLLRYAEEWITTRLSDRQAVQLPYIGSFAPVYIPDYLLANRDGTYTLMPPSIGLDYRADSFLLNDKNYTTLDTEAPDHPVPPEMITAIADLHALDSGVVEQELTEYFSLFFTRLFRGRRVQLLGLADFFITEESGHLLLNIEWTPQILETLSYPFRPYKPITLPAGQALPEAEIYDSEPDNGLLQVAVRHTAPDPTPEPHRPAVEEIPLPTPRQAPTPPATPAPKQRSHSRLLVGLLVGLLGCGAVAGIALWLWRAPLTSDHGSPAAPRSLPPVVKATPVTTPDSVTPPAPADTIVPTEPAVEQPTTTHILATDTLGSGQSLAQLARKHYGKTIHWVYIYIQNSDHLTDANNIPPGTVLEIPDLEIFGLKKDNTEAVTEAREWAALILNRKFASYKEQRPTLPCNK